MTTSLKETPAGSDGLHVDGVSRHSHIQLCVGGIRVYKYDNILAGVYRFAMYTLPNAWLCRASKMLRLIPSDLDFESGSPLVECVRSLSSSGLLGSLHLRPVFPPTAVCAFAQSSSHIHIIHTGIQLLSWIASMLTYLRGYIDPLSYTLP